MKMFDTKRYHREYMREYRKKPLTPEALAKRNEYARQYAAKRRLTDPAWVEKERARGREYARKKRLDPEARKAQYKKHTEWARKNKAYINAMQRKRYEQPETRLKAKANILKSKYGLPLDEYMQMRRNQNEECAVCLGPLGMGAVDHDHATGQVRDLLCRQCNCWIGFIERSPDLVVPMQQYLARWKEIQRIKKETA